MAERATSDRAMKAGVHPARPRPHRESGAGARRTGAAVLAPLGPFAFTIVYRGCWLTSWDTGTPDPASICKIRATPSGGIPADVQRRQHDPAIALPADQRTLIPHGTSDVSLTHRRPDEPGPIIPCGILHHQAGGQVHHNCGLAPPPPAPFPALPALPPQVPSLPQTPAYSPRLTASPSHPPAPIGPHPGRRPCQCRPWSPAPGRPSSTRFSGIGSGARGNRPSA